MKHKSQNFSVNEEIRRHLEYLTLKIGERHLGSPGEKKAQDYIECEFRLYGYEVKREEFSTPGWNYDTFSIRTEDQEEIPCFPCFFSPGGSLSAPLRTFWPEFDSDKTLERFAGAVVFAGNFDFERVANTNALAEKLEAAGAAALIINSPYNDTFSTKIVRSPNLKRMPVFTISQRTALRLAREEGKNIFLDLKADRFDHTSANIVARYRPENSSRGKIVIGGHYDTSPGIAGAYDNASGIAVLLQLARALRQDLGDWEVDFVAFGGEEYGGPGYGIGGYSYMQDHMEEKKHIKAMICIDGVGTYLSIPEARIGRSGALRDIVTGTVRHSQFRIKPHRVGSDQGIFHKHGIPTVLFTDGGAPSGVRHYPLHSPQDTMEILDLPQLKRIALDVEAVIRQIMQKGLVELTDVQVVQATSADHPMIQTLVREVWTMGYSYLQEQLYGRIVGEPWQNKVSNAVTGYLQTSGVHALKAEIEGDFAGFISYRVNSETRIGEIGYNAVKPGFTGKGIGKKMLEQALQKLQQAGMEHAEVVTGLDPGHAAARNIYEAAGFVPVQNSVRYTLKLD